MAKYAARSLVLSIGANPVAQVTAMGQVGSTRDLIDASAYGDDWKSYVLGQQDGDEVAITLAYDPSDTEHTALKTAYDTAAETSFGLSHAESAFDVTFTAIVTNFTRGGDIGGLLQADATLKIIEPGVVDAS